jgi:hypothetical protein
MITAIVRAYWKERLSNLERIVNDLKNGSLVPDRIVVWCNNKDISIKELKKLGVETVESSFNGQDRSLFATSVLFRSDYYLYIDDDTTVRKDTLKNIFSYTEKYPDACIGLRGKIIDKKSRSPYTVNTINVLAYKQKYPRYVHLLIGKGTILYSFENMVKMFEMEKEFLKDKEYDELRELDILLSMANRSVVIPAKDEQTLRDLGEGKVGFCKQAGHYPKRNNIIKRILEIPKE